ncbi:MAG: LPXTG cell wall anchor domain-containing protein [Lachnospiraceae bacterium]
MKVRKGVFGAVLILCATLCMTNVTALADDGTHTHPICGTTHTDIGDHTGECADVVWTAWDGTSDIDYGDDNTAYVYLSGNSERSEQFAVKDGKTLYLCLNGYSITRTTDSTDAFDSVIRVYGDAQLVLCDCKVSGTITHSADVYGRGVRLGDSSSTGDFIMYGGEISGNRIDISAHSAAAGDGAGVESQLSDFTMYGGKITNNHVINGSNNEGGGVNMHTGGTFTMYGGEISGNACSDTGGGVISAGAYLKLYGGTISNNTADKRGGGVFTNMTLTISDGITITGNKSEQGGGIYTYDEDITINGGNITGNTATYGGGVYHIGDYRTCDTLTISGSATITGNTATDGGGVYVESGKNTSNWNKGQGALQINGGSITNNTATGNGGGVYINERGLLTITGGNVTDNTATVNGGGVYFNGESKKFNISGNINVTGIKKSGKANNIYLPNGQIIKIMGELTNTAPIGVTTEVEPNSSNYVQIASGRAAYATPDKFQYENNDTSISAVLSGSNNLLIACEHNWGITWQTDSTSHWHSCSICNGKDNIVNHSGGTATCTEKAICEGCSLPYGNTLGHDFTGDTWQTDADHHWKKCSRCDVTDTESPHEWNSGKVTTQPTCTTAGQKTYTCTVCSATKVETLDALGHNFAKYDAKAATCTEIGWNTYFTCTNCNYTTYKEIAALGHDKVSHNGKAATCTEKGWNAYDTCSRCDYTTYKEIAALGHDFTSNTWQSDAHRHWKKCSRCKAAGKKTQHTGGTATCKDRAVCTTCSKAYGTLDAKHHVGGTEIRDMVEPTTKKAGHTGNSYCKGCNTKLSDGTVIPVISNLSTGKKSDLATALKDMEKFLNSHGSNYTANQKKQLIANINAIKSALKSIENTEKTVKKAEAMPAADKIQPDDKAAIAAYEDAKKAYDALSAGEKNMAGEHTKAILDTMLKALTAYDITSGDGSTWKENNKDNGLTFKVNGYHKKFAGIVINGTVVNKKYYEIEAGSTIITLKAEYLQTLPAGNYTLLVQYTDGSTDGEDTFTITKNESATPSDPTNPTDPSSPKTGDNSHPVVWIGILIVCAGIWMLLFFKKQKQETK